MEGITRRREEPLREGRLLHRIRASRRSGNRRSADVEEQVTSIIKIQNHTAKLLVVYHEVEWSDDGVAGLAVAVQRNIGVGKSRSWGVGTDIPNAATVGVHA